MKIRHADHREKIQLQMTPMIDIVFQLLIFFIMTFKIVLPEGDFNIRMPLPSEQTEPKPMDITPTLSLRMRAGDNGALAAIQLGDSRIESFGALRQQIIDLTGGAGGPGTANEQEVEITADYDLRYEHVIQAITALSGYLEDGKRHALIEKIRFAPPVE